MIAFRAKGARCPVKRKPFTVPEHEFRGAPPSRAQIKAARALADYHGPVLPETPSPEPRHKRPLESRLLDADVARFHDELARFRERNPDAPMVGRVKPVAEFRGRRIRRSA